MTARRQAPLLEKDLDNRYSLSLTEFKKNVYLHIKDSFGKPAARRVSLHLTAIQELNKVLPEFLRQAEESKRALSCEENEDIPAKRFKAADGI